MTMIRCWLVAAAVLLASPALADDGIILSRGQTVYAPVYSHILHGNQGRRGKPESWLLSAMLSVRNTDLRGAMMLRSVRYVDSNGKMLREFIAQPQMVGPMATVEFFVDQQDSSGGSGANFVVVWQAEHTINAPIIETVHSYFMGNHSTAFISPSRVIRGE